ncbi:MAG: hypothetical protein HOV68_11365 [Streptomycetaceae bacterium]|nr:hypothetical protein [Streptomycetaceae bacterium]
MRNTKSVLRAEGLPALSRSETLAYLLGERSKSTNRTVSLRRSFVQILEQPGRGSSPKKPGPLHKLMRSPAALELFLLVHAVAIKPPFDITERSETWARAAGLTFARGRSASEAVSRQWAVLKKHNLVSVERDGPFARIVKLLEDGSNTPYSRPRGRADVLSDIYFQVPFAYWYDGWHERLGMPAKAVLLIAMSNRAKEFPLPQGRRFQQWYGISPNSVTRGIDELVQHEVLTATMSDPFITGETDTGRGVRLQYSLMPPFDLNLRTTPAPGLDTWEFPLIQESTPAASPSPTPSASATPGEEHA